MFSKSEIKKEKEAHQEKQMNREESDEEKYEGIEEVAGDTEEKRRREKDEETRGRGPEYKSLQGLAVSPLPSQNRSTLETRGNNKNQIA